MIVENCLFLLLFVTFFVNSKRAIRTLPQRTLLKHPQKGMFQKCFQVLSEEFFKQHIVAGIV